MSESPRMSLEPRHDFTGEVIQEELDRLSDQELVSKYNPKFLGYGAEQVVFEIPGHSKVVAKVHKAILESSVQAFVEEGRGFDEVPEDFEKLKRVYLKNEKRRQGELKKYFGNAVPNERPVAMRVPVTIPLLEASIDFDLARKVPDEVHEVLTLVRIQEKAPVAALDPETSVSNAFRYVEREVSINVDVYGRVNEMLVDGHIPVDEDVIPTVIKDDESILRLKADPELSRALRDFTERAIAYSMATGELLDLAGQNNVSFYKEDDEWKYFLMDAKYPDENRFTKAREQVERFIAGKALNHEQANWIMNALGYIRTLNLISELTGSEKRIRLSDNAIAPHSERLLALLKKQFED